MKIFIYTLIGVCLIPRVLFSYDADRMHPKINENVSKTSLNLKSTLAQTGMPTGVETFVNGKKIFDWFRIGGQKEDNWPRWMQHFHDPNKSWDVAGLKSDRTSSIYWAQQEFQDAWANWSWPHARRYYYEGLTALSEEEREKNLAKSFRALGQVLHLLADGSVPAHTRDDAHPEGDSYEKYCEKEFKSIPFAATSIGTGITNHSLVPGLEPISNYWDTIPAAGTNPNTYGLAEYTNRYFFSKDTIFDKDYPYPSWADSTSMSVWMDKITTPSGTTDYKVYLSGKLENNKILDHLVNTGYLWSELQAIAPGGTNDGRYILDEECLKEYAGILVPKAVGYGAGLLDYFYRGKFDASARSTIDSNGNITELTIDLTNQTPNEGMVGGNFVLAYHYLAPGASQPTYGITTTVPSGNITFNGTTELIFDFVNPDSENPPYIPAGATDKAFTLVYQGQLGNETNAVIGKIIDLIEGEIAVTAPDRFLYAIADDGNTSGAKHFTEIRAKLRSNSPNVVMTGGEVIVKARFKRHLTHQDDLLNEPPMNTDRSYDFEYVTAKPVTVDLSDTAATDVVLDFSADPIPFGVTDLSLDVFYRKGGIDVAYSNKDINEPHYFVIWNSHDRFLVDRDLDENDTVHDWVLMTEGEILNDAALVERLDEDNGGLIDSIIDPVTIDADMYFAGAPFASPGDWHASFRDIPAGHFGRVAILADAPEIYVAYHDKYTSSYPASTFAGDYLKHDEIKGFKLYSVVNQEEQTDQGTNYFYTPISRFRSIAGHFNYISVDMFPRPLSSTEEYRAILDAAWPAPVSTTPVPATATNP